jgi:hypothetical protein
MSDLTTLLALAERCEQAAGPDRELDAEIALAIGYTREKKGRQRIAWWRNPKGQQLGYDGWHNFPPSFTASLDAAVTLVPEGWGYELRQGNSGARRALCRMWDGRGIWTRGTVAATPALALCAAALLAPAALGEKE